MFKIIFIFIAIGSCLLFLPDSKAKKSILINGKPIVCNREAYNCTAYDGPYLEKRLNSCADVKTVWVTCKGDVHGLDGDNDGHPCEECPSW